MAGACTSVRGAALAGLIDETRSIFLTSPSATTYDPQLPNSLRLVALDTFTKRAEQEKLKIFGELIDVDTDLPIERDAARVFIQASTAGEYVEDLICEVVCQELYRDVAVRTEDASRIALGRTK
jgi:hypothetical protein